MLRSAKDTAPERFRFAAAAGGSLACVVLTTKQSALEHEGEGGEESTYVAIVTNKFNVKSTV
jgi:hypothetical protein